MFTAGFALSDDWKTCNDVDECLEEGQNDCEPDEICVNNEGSYRCEYRDEVCDLGSQFDPVSKTCVETFDPCADPNPCGDHGECQAIPKALTFSCHCNQGIIAGSIFVQYLRGF